MDKYYTDKTKKRLNKTGRGLYATRMRLQGYSEGEIAQALNIDVDKVNRLYGIACGLLGLFDRHPVGTSAKDILKTEYHLTLLSRLDILIAKKGDKLFTTDALPRSHRSSGLAEDTLAVWADGSTALMEDLPVSWKSDDYIVLGKDTKYAELVQWIGKKAAKEFCEEYEIFQ